MAHGGALDAVEEGLVHELVEHALEGGHQSDDGRVVLQGLRLLFLQVAQSPREEFLQECEVPLVQSHKRTFNKPDVLREGVDVPSDGCVADQEVQDTAVHVDGGVRQS